MSNSSSLDTLVGLIPLAIGGAIVMKMMDKYDWRTERSGVRSHTPRRRRKRSMNTSLNVFAEEGRAFREATHRRKKSTRVLAGRLSLGSIEKHILGSGQKTRFQSIVKGLGSKTRIKLY